MSVWPVCCCASPCWCAALCVAQLGVCFLDWMVFFVWDERSHGHRGRAALWASIAPGHLYRRSVNFSLCFITETSCLAFGMPLGFPCLVRCTGCLTALLGSPRSPMGQAARKMSFELLRSFCFCKNITSALHTSTYSAGKAI